MKPTRLMVAALFLCAAMPAFAATSRFGEIVESFNSLQLGPSGPVSGVTYTIGHMKVTLNSGSAAPVRAGKDIVGIYFKGNGTLDYETTDPIEFPLMKHNAKVQDLKVTVDGGKGRVTGNFDSALLYIAGDKLPQIGTGGGADLSADFRAHVEELSRNRSFPPVNMYLLQNFVTPAAKLARLEFKSGRDSYMYVYDPLESHYEWMTALRYPDTLTPEFKRRLNATVLSLQPIDFNRKNVPPQPVVLTAVDYTLVADGDKAKLDVSETITRLSENQKAIRLSLDDEFFVKPGAGFRNLHLLGVTDNTGRALPFLHKNGEVVIGLEDLPGKQVNLKFSIEGDFLIRPNNDNFWQLGVRAWFPQPESLAGMYYTVHSTIKVKKPFIALAPGTVIRKGEEGDFNVLETSIDKPIQFAVVHAGKYEVTEETRNGVTIRVAAYGGKNERAAKQLTNLAFQIIDFFQYFLGPYPFDHLNIIQVNTWGYGQAPPGTMFITNEAFDSMLGDVNQFFSEGINERFAHEIAHQYWAHVVKMPSFEEQWLTETFAEYSAALLIKKMKGVGAYNRLITVMRDRAKMATDAAPIPLANYLAGPRSFNDRFYLIYFKGALILYKLHQELGDEQFLTFLKSYQKSFRFKFGTTNDIAGLLQFMTKKDYRPFIDQYFWGTAMP